MEEIRRLIIEEINCTLNVKMLAISPNASKTFLARYLFDDCNDGKVELLKDGQMEKI
jgi:hypothetical protein